MIARVLMLLSLVACGEAMEMPEDASAESGPLVCETEEDVSGVVFATTCATSRCHDAEASRGRLDLETPGFTERIRARPSVHERCRDQVLLVPGDPANSFLMRKVLGSQGNCGDPMPNRGDITPAQRRCIAEWISNAPSP